MRRKLLYALVAAVMAFSACASGSDTPSPASTTSEGKFPVTIEASGGSVVIEKKPTKIVSLSPTATEMLFAIGAGPQTIAVDDQSNYPAEAPKTDLSGFKPNIEAIAGYGPDLVVYSNDIAGLKDSLAKVSIPALLQPAALSLDDTYKEIQDLGAATGNSAQAEKIVQKMKSDIKTLSASAKSQGEGKTYYHELDNTLYTATSKTYIGQIYALVGMKNIADAADKDGSGYPQVSAEFIVSADPDFIFLGDTKCCNESPQTVAQRPGWGDIKAVKQGQVVGLDDDVASRWGPRVVDLLRVISEAVAKSKG